MDPEDIVRSLAARSARSLWSDEGIEGCLLCGHDDEDDPASAHDPECEWRLSREWVSEHPEGPTEIVGIPVAQQEAEMMFDPAEGISALQIGSRIQAGDGIWKVVSFGEPDGTRLRLKLRREEAPPRIISDVEIQAVGPVYDAPWRQAQGPNPTVPERAERDRE